MKKIILITIMLGLFHVSVVMAQITFERTYGGVETENGYSVQQTSDGGYIITGSTKSFGPSAGVNYSVYLIKTDANGDTLWTKVYGGTNRDCGCSVQETSDEGYIIVGYTKSFGAGDYDVYLIKTDANGDALWSRTYGGTNRDYGYSVQETSDGGYIVAGRTRSFGAGSYDVYLIKTDSSGDTLWTGTYGGIDDDESYSVQETSDGGYIVAGWTFLIVPPPGSPHNNVYLIKTDTDGDTLWTRQYGGADDDESYSVQETSDGGYIVAGMTKSFGAGSNDVYLIKTDTDGDTLWTCTYGGSVSDQGQSVQQTSDGGYIIAGNTKSFGAGDSDVWLIKTDALGDTLWTKTFGGIDSEYAYGVQQTTDNGYIVAGTLVYADWTSDVYLIKVAGEPQLNPPLATTATTDGTLTFFANWEASAGATGYYLDVATDASFTSYLTGFENKDVGDVLTYSITAEEAIDHYYRLRAYNANGTSGNSNVIVVSGSTLPVELSSFTAQFIGSSPILCWTTQSETGNAGWNVYRGDYRDAFINGDAIQINPELIEGAGTTSIPTNYTFEDQYNVVQGSEYWYILESVDYSGATQIHGSVSLIIPEEGTIPELPQQTVLMGNYPNPFNPNTTISFMVKENETAYLSIFNIKGQKVENIRFEAGIYNYLWDASSYSSGIYLYKLKSESFSEIRKMILLK